MAITVKVEDSYKVWDGILEEGTGVEGLFPRFKRNLIDPDKHELDISEFVKAEDRDGELVLTLTYIPMMHYEADGPYELLDDPFFENAYDKADDRDWDEYDGRPNLGSSNSSMDGGTVFIAPAEKPIAEYLENPFDYEFSKKWSEKTFKLEVEVAGVLYQVEGFINED